MKKALIAMAAGAMTLGASVVPASAGTDYLGYSIWEGIQEDEEDACNYGSPYGNLSLFEQLVLIGGWADRLDTTGNGKPFYTVFAPYDAVIDGVLDALGTSVSELSTTPAVVSAILADHIANGSIGYDDLYNETITRITMRSGYTAVWDYDNWEIAGAYVDDSYQFDNGWLHCLQGFIDTTPQVPVEGLNSLDTPKDGTPGGTNSLPNTL